MAGVTLSHVSKAFRDVAAVKDISISIQDKEFMVFVGPSGCGKTTTLRMIAGLESPTDGEIYIGDRLVNNVPPKDRDIAMVFQNYALYPHMCVFDNLAFGLKMRRVPKPEIQQRVGAGMKMLGLDGLLKRKPGELSGGQRQRVALGRAIVREPKVFLMDEPLSNLDAKLRIATRAELIKLHRRLETTVVYVTHDQVEAMTMGTRIAVMKDGLLQQCDSPETIYDRPANMFVAGFIGSPTMNFVRAKVVERDGALRFDAGMVALPVPTDRIAAVRPYLGQEVQVGVRPEDVRLRRDQQQGAPLEAQVDVVERMGSETVVHLVAGATTIVAVMDGRVDVTAGQKIEIAVDPAHLHIFDPSTELAIR